ncbi:MAG: type II secretion system F family protein, partial [Flavobacteriaceae bacterium]|nr:type II secretion system F family protein [Flavobacteriaceae bacterium]
VDFKKALEILKQQQKKTQQKELIDTIMQDVVKGKSLFEAIRDTGKFSNYEFFSIKIGEETRRLEAVLQQLYVYFDKKIKMRRQLVSVLAYPILVLGLVFGALYFMLNHVVPMFANIFKQFDKELPDITKYVLWLSDNFRTIALVIFAIVAGVILIHKSLKDTEQYRKVTTKVALKIPFFGKLLRQIYITRFCQTMSLLLSAKTPLIESLDLVQKMISFYPIEKSLDTIKKEVLKGALFSTSLAKHSIYDYKLLSMVSVGEQINRLDEMFEKLAHQYEEETEHKTKMLGVVLDPLLIVIIGSVVGFVLIAMYVPMFELTKVITPG